MNYRKIFLPLVALLVSLLVSGCDYGDVKITNLTPETLAENHSNVYTLSVSVKPKTKDVINESIRANIVIDGETFPMVQSPVSPDLFEFEYHLPAGRQDASYYFLADYQVEKRDFIKNREAFSDIHSFKLVNRYAFSLDVTRAPVGARVGVVGRGFKRNDRIMIGDMEAPTTYSSANSISFNVPPIEPGANYLVQLTDGESLLNVGTLRVDPGRITVSPESLTLIEGERSMVVFSAQSEAPVVGLYINVETDIPDSIIMPEVVIPGGARSVNVPIQGGVTGRGSLFIEMNGYEPVRVPVTVR
ncbi:MAG TPA: IPT/TIG domain-containing protein [Opitutales bacterium]|nr:IPT/TIG domain-containing protein [Opitutales bacterium]